MLASLTGLRRGARSIPLALFVTTLVVTGGVGLAISMTDRAELVPLAIVALVAIALVGLRLELCLWAFILATAVNRFNFDFAGWQVKIEHMVLLLVLVVWGLRFLSAQEHVDRWPLMTVIGGFLSLGFIASVLNSADLYKSIRILTRMSFAVLAYLLIVNHIRGSARLWRFVAVFLAVAFGAATYGVLSAAVWHLAEINLGMQYSSITGVWSPYGTLWEGNIFGGYVMSACVTSLVLLVSELRTINRGFLWMVFAITAGAMLLSMARAAWLGFICSILLMLLCRIRIRLRKLVAVLGMSALGLLVWRGANQGGVFQDVLARVATLRSALQDINVVSRLTNTDIALREWLQKPWIGWGIDGYHINHPDILSALPSPQLNALYDTGLLGACLFVLLVLTCMARALAVVRTADGGRNGVLVTALLSSFLGLLVAFQATDAFWLGFTWVHLSLLMAAVLVGESGEGRHAIMRQGEAA